MNRIILPLLLLVAVLIGGAWWLSGRTCATAAAPSSGTTMSIMDGAFNTKMSGLHFNQDASQLNGGANAENTTAFQSLVAHLKANPEKQLTVTGNYASSETGTSRLDNLGLDRADAIKALLVKMGANGDQINLASNMQNSIQLADGNKIYNGVNFNFMEAAPEPKAPVVDPSSADFKPLNLRFPTGQANLKLTPEIQAYFNGLKSYMEANPGSKVAVIGHTDNVGSIQGNMTLSRRRARDVSNFMMANGFTTSQIAQSHEGPNKPMATNDTEEGRQKNRRVEIRIK